MKTILILLIITARVACSKVQGIHPGGRTLAMAYKIKWIKCKKDFYLIYAMRNDSLFEIISDVDSTATPNCETIKTGSRYILNLQKNISSRLYIRNGYSS